MERLKEVIIFILKIAALTFLALGMSGMATWIVDLVLGTNYATADNIGLMALCTVTLHFGFSELMEATSSDEYDE